jgi:hypothetical protein
MSASAPTVINLQVPGTIATTSAVAMRMPFDGRIVGLTAAVGTAPVGSALTLDIKTGTTVKGAVSIAAGAVSAAGTLVASQDLFAQGAVVEVDVTAVGSSTAGANLVVTLVVDQSADQTGQNEYDITVLRGGHPGGVQS